VKDIWNGLIFPSTRHLELPDPGPPPTCPFILHQQCQRAKNGDAGGFPLLGLAGRPAFLRPHQWGPCGPRRCGERAYMGGSSARQQRFCIFCDELADWRSEGSQKPDTGPAGHPT
jgi:hypothetical protein